MDEKQYLALATACDSILKEHRSSLVRLSISWLHIVREHPLFLQRYTRIFTASALESRYRWFGFKRTVAETGRILRQLVRGFIHSVNCHSGSHALATADVVFVAHLINHAQQDADTDIYFDRLPANLSRCGFKVVVLLIDHTTKTCSQHQVNTMDSGVTRIVLANTLGFLAELDILTSLSRESTKLLAGTDGSDFVARVRVAAAAEAYSSGAMHTIRTAKQIAKLVKQLNATTLVTTFEGHAWERATYMEARRQQPGLRCAGYQHAPLFRLQHGLQRMLYEACDPDTIFTSGLKAYKQLKHTLEHKDIRNLGSARAGTQIVLTDVEVLNRRKTPCCLVLLDGLVNEAAMLAELSLKCAQCLPEFTFIWRTHPILPFDMLVNQIPALNALPANVQLSVSTLEEDARKSSWVLYKGSSAVISAALAGAEPVYFDSKEEMTLDPLYAIRHAAIKQVDDFIAIAETDSDMTALQSSKVLQHCLDIFTPLDSEVMVSYLNESKRLV